MARHSRCLLFERQRRRPELRFSLAGNVDVEAEVACPVTTVLIPPPPATTVGGGFDVGWGIARSPVALVAWEDAEATWGRGSLKAETRAQNPVGSANKIKGLVSRLGKLLTNSDKPIRAAGP